MGKIMWDLLVGAAVEAGVGLIASAGFEDELKGLTARWRGADARARQVAFDQAVEQAFAGIRNAAEQEQVRSLVEQRHIRNEMIAGLLDPMTGFDVRTLADEMGERFPQQARSLRRFFSNLESALLQDELWGTVLERFQELRFRQDVIAALQEQKIDLKARQLVQELGVRLEGSGAIAQGDGAVAAGEGGVAVGGNVGQVIQLFIQELTLANGGSTLPDDATLQQRYLQHVAKQSSILRGLDYASSDPSTHVQMKLADVYINLDTTVHVRPEEAGAPREKQRLQHDADELLVAQDEEARPLPVLEAFVANPHMVLLGAPGGGKSTFVNHLTFCLASHGLQPDTGWLDRLPGWPTDRQGLTPLRVVLREVAAWLPSAKPEQSGSGLLMAYLDHWLEQIALDGYCSALGELLHSGRCLLLFDGLDEVPVDAALRERIIQMIEAVGVIFSNCPTLVTSRVLSYREEAGWQLDAQSWRDFELAAFSEEKIEAFVHTWYQQLEQLGQVDDAEERSQRLLQAVHRPDLWRLAGTPLLLTVMAMVHARNNELPDARALLYEEVVDLLLWRWEAIKIRSKDGNETDLRQMLSEARLTDIDLKQLLWETAFNVHDSVRDQGSEATADIRETTLLRGLQRLHPDKDLKWADQMVQIIKQRAGLLVEDVPGIYSFPHRTFQEYLAACYLSSLGDFGEKGSELAARGVFWREVLLLAVGRLIHSGDTDRPLVLLSHLCAAAEQGDSKGNSDEPTWSQAWRAGEALLEIGLDRANRRPLGAPMIAQTQKHLTTLITEDHLSCRERAEAGAVLAQIGDARDLEEMIDIPAGPFTMGSTQEEIAGLIERFEQNKEWWEKEGDQHEVTLPEFLMSKYPVTNQQYAHFVEATGHRAPRHWSGTKPPRTLLTHPVVYVSWHDAVAYCAWLTGEKGAVYRLPTEAEWEKAARGADDARTYPWGSTFDANRCNMYDTGIGTTSPVGIFKVGASPYGCLDMVGNVWEWTQSLYQGYPYEPDDGREDLAGAEPRTLRGGAWDDFDGVVRCAVRSDGSPTYGDVDVGFRVMSPGF